MVSDLPALILLVAHNLTIKTLYINRLSFPFNKLKTDFAFSP